MDTSGGGVCVSKMVHTPSSSPAGSAKSEKNMADFEGEDYMSEEELSRIGGLQHQETHQRGAGIQRPCCPRSPPQATRGQLSSPLISNMRNDVVSRYVEIFSKPIASGITFRLNQEIPSINKTIHFLWWILPPQNSSTNISMIIQTNEHTLS